MPDRRYPTLSGRWGQTETGQKQSVSLTCYQTNLMPEFVFAEKGTELFFRIGFAAPKK
jgi:hypothetical protein